MLETKERLRLMMIVAGQEVTFETHLNPHLDEITAYWLIKRFGDIAFLFNHVKKQETWLTIRVGGGKFDEHAVNGGKRKEDESAATLVAKALGIEEDPALEGILKFVKRQDTKGGMRPFDIVALIGAFYDARWPIDKIIHWVCNALDARYEQQLHFLTATKQEFERAADVEKISTDEKELVLVTIKSDDKQIARLARSDHGANADIVILQNSSGNVQIFVNKRARIGNYVKEIAKILRLEEQKAKGDLVTTDWNTLEDEGKVEGAEEWYYLPEGQMILNGSKTAPNVPSTLLSLEKIQDIVRIGINHQLFERSRRSFCQRGECINPCPWYKYGLWRCRNIRREMRRNNNL